MKNREAASSKSDYQFAPNTKANRLLSILVRSAVFASFTIASTAVNQGTTWAQASDAPLIEKNDLVYQGAFRLPEGGDESNTFAYGGRALAYNPANNSLFVVGHVYKQRTAEINIPSIVKSNALNDLKRASLIQSFSDTTEGRLSQINPSDPNPQRIGGQLVYGDKLIVTGFSYYDGSGTQSFSHFSRSLTLSTRGQVSGPYAVGRDAHFTSAYMADVPQEWQSQFGGPALTGNCCRSIISNQSHGPALSVFNPTDLGEKNPVPATELLYYTGTHPLGSGIDTKNPLYNLTTRVTGVAFPVGTRSVLFFGEHGVGDYCYGEGSTCGDPAKSDKGTHAFPYKYQVWAYDANDLLAVKNGSTLPYSLTPYSVWNFEMPFVGDSSSHEIGGVAYDAEGNRLFVAQISGDSYGMPVIHVFSITKSIRPGAPGNLDIQ